MNHPPLGLVVIDDNALALDALERWLSSGADLRWLGGASHPDKALALISEKHPDIVLLDVDMPGVDTFALLDQIGALHPGVKVVMFSGFVRSDYVERALAAGASGYVIKDEPFATTIDFLRRAAEGECVLSNAAAAAFMQG